MYGLLSPTPAQHHPLVATDQARQYSSYLYTLLLQSAKLQYEEEESYCFATGTVSTRDHGGSGSCSFKHQLTNRVRQVTARRWYDLYISILARNNTQSTKNGVNFRIINCNEHFVKYIYEIIIFVTQLHSSWLTPTSSYFTKKKPTHCDEL